MCTPLKSNYLLLYLKTDLNKFLKFLNTVCTQIYMNFVWIKIESREPNLNYIAWPVVSY